MTRMMDITRESKDEKKERKEEKEKRKKKMKVEKRSTESNIKPPFAGRDANAAGGGRCDRATAAKSHDSAAKENPSKIEK